MSIPVPPATDQTAIGRVLDSVDEALTRHRSALQSGRDVKQAILQEFFFSALGETAYADRPRRDLPEGWSLVPARRLIATEPQNGVSPEAFAQPPGVPTFNIAAIRNGRLNLTTDQYLKYVRVSPNVAARYTLNPAEVLIVRGNANSDLVGKAALVEGVPQDCIFPDITKRLTFRVSDVVGVTPQFAVLAWNHSVVHNQILRRAKTSNGTLKINNRDVKDIVLPVPPPDQQANLVRLARAADERIDAAAVVASRLVALRRALSHDLLTGRVRLRESTGVTAP